MNSRPMNPRIVALSGPLKGQAFPITETPLTFGRAEDNSVCLDDEMVSRYHFSVMLKDGLAFLLDAQTRNGTYVNGRPRLERFLEPGDRIKCGSTIFIYFELDEDSEAVPRLIDDE